MDKIKDLYTKKDYEKICLIMQANNNENKNPVLI